MIIKLLSKFDFMLKIQRQYLLTLQVSRYCILHLQSSIDLNIDHLIEVSVESAHILCHIHSASSNHPVNTKHLYDICTKLVQCRRRCADVVQMLYKCFVFTGLQLMQF